MELSVVFENPKNCLSFTEYGHSNFISCIPFFFICSNHNETLEAVYFSVLKNFFWGKKTNSILFSYSNGENLIGSDNCNAFLLAATIDAIWNICPFIISPPLNYE